MDNNENDKFKEIERTLDKKFLQIEDTLNQIGKDSTDKFEKSLNWMVKIPTWLIAAITAIIFAAALIGGINYIFAIKRIERLSNRVENIISEAEKKPELEIMTDEGEPLEGKTIPALISEVKKENKIILIFFFVMKNTGTASTTPMYVQIYSKNPLQIKPRSPSVDESAFDHYLLILPEKLTGKGVLPPQLSTRMIARIPIDDYELIKLHGNYPILVKAFFGQDKPLRTKFNIQIRKIEVESISDSS